MKCTLVHAVLPLGLLAASLGSPARAVVYVRLGAAPGGDGRSWQTALPTLQQGLNVGQDDEVWVAEGTYTGTFYAPVSVALYGGFAGTETARDQRDPAAHPTILDGNAAGSVLTIDEFADNAVVDGFTVRNGKADKGAGLYSRAAHLAVNACTFTGNTAIATANYVGAGGGLFAQGAAVTVTNCLFEGNRSLGGGGLWIDSDASVIRGCTIHNNGAYAGGGASVNGAAAEVDHNIIIDNGGGGMTDYVEGGGLLFRATSGRIENNLVADNRITAENEAYGGGISASEGALVVNNTIVNNMAYNPFIQFASKAEGGGLYGGGTVANNILAGNSVNTPSDPNGNLNTPADRVHHNVLDRAVPSADLRYAPANILDDPGFADPKNGDYHLAPGSPAIDTGDDALVQAGETDLDGKPRIVGAHVDIGAYEYPTSPVPVAPVYLSDAVRALKIACGLVPAQALDLPRLDRVDGDSAGRIDIADAVRLLRQALGTDANPG